MVSLISFSDLESKSFVIPAVFVPLLEDSSTLPIARHIYSLSHLNSSSIVFSEVLSALASKGKISETLEIHIGDTGSLGCLLTILVESVDERHLEHLLFHTSYATRLKTLMWIFNAANSVSTKQLSRVYKLIRFLFSGNFIENSDMYSLLRPIVRTLAKLLPSNSETFETILQFLISQLDPFRADPDNKYVVLRLLKDGIESLDHSPKSISNSNSLLVHVIKKRGTSIDYPI